MKINLVPEVKQEQNRVRKLNMITTSVATFVGIGFAVIIVVLLSYNVARKAQISRIDADTTKINSELEAYKDLEQTVTSLETGLAQVKQVLNGGPKWSSFFSEIEKVTPGDTQITSFDIKSQAISMEVKGKEVKSIDRFIRSFASFKVNDRNLFSDVAVSGYTKETNGNVTFSAKMNLVGGVLW
jgi:Tfp pilus assembly protein PilN